MALEIEVRVRRPIGAAASSSAKALAMAAKERADAGDLVFAGADPAAGPVPGVALIAMGKMGAGELNYSSDIDFMVFEEGTSMSTLGVATTAAFVDVDQSRGDSDNDDTGPMLL